MINPRKASAELADALAGNQARRKELGRLRSRVELIASDLDCDADGSLASELAALRDAHNDLRARIDEWIPTIAENAAREEDMR